MEKTTVDWRVPGILLLAAVLRVIFFTGYHGYDDVFYITRAHDLSHGIFSVPRNHWEARIGLVGPTALAYRLFGVTLWSTTLFPFACSLAGVGAAIGIGRRLFNQRVGLIAGLLVACFPMDAIFASMLFPTATVTLLTGLGFGLFLLGEKEDRPVLHLASGIAFGLAAVAHETAILGIVFYPVYVAVTRRPRRAHLLGLAGMLAGILVDPLVHALMGDPLARLHALARAGTAQGTAGDVAYRGFNRTWLFEPIIRLFAERTFGIFPWLVAPLAIYRAAFATRAQPTDPTERNLSLIIIAVFVWTEYGTMSPRAYAPLSRLPRYLSPLTLPAAWLLARYLADVAGSRPRRIALAALAATSVGCLLLDSGNRLHPYESVRDALAKLQPEIVAVDKGDDFSLTFAEGMHPHYRLQTGVDQVPPHALVVTSRAETRSRFEGTPGFEHLLDAQQPMTTYEKLLRSPAVLRVLKLVRPPERFREYADKAKPWTLTVYRAP